MARKPKPKSELRKQAERIIGKGADVLPKMTPDDTANLVHEFEVNKVELELQNEELHAIHGELTVQNEDLRVVQEELKESRDRYADLYDYAPTSYFILNERTQQIIGINLTACNLLGMERSLVLNTRFSKYVEPEFADLFHTCSRKALANHKETCEIKMHRKDGSVFWALLEVNGLAETKQLRISATDITRRKNMEEELRIKDYAIGSAMVGIGITDLKGRLTYVNRAMVQMGGYEEKDVLGKGAFEFFIDENKMEEALKEVIEKGSWQGEAKAKRKDGSIFDVQAWADLVTDSKGKPICIMASLADITQRKQMEQALQDSYHDLNHAQAVAKFGSWRLDVQQNVLNWSEESYQIFGIPKGTPLTYEKFLSAVHPEDRKYVDEKWNAALKGEPYDIEHRIIVGNEIKWIHEKAELEFDEQGKLLGGFGTCQDITDRKQTEAEITHLASFPELNPNPILELDAEGNIKYINPAARALFPDLRIQGNNHPFLANWIALVNTLEKERLPFLTREIEVSGHWYGQTVTGVPSSQNLRLYSRDITERKRQEQIKDEFIGMVSHEIKTPLTIIIGALSVAVEKGVTAAESRELLGDAVSSAEYLAAIVENLLELSRHQAKRLTITKEPVNILQIAEVVIGKLCDKSALHRLIVDIPETLPPLSADPIRIERILYNLVDNAIKYSPKGGEVRIFVRHHDGSIVVGVRDPGIGISSKDQARLFQSFERLNMYSNSDTPGIGLGLKVSRILVEAHNGRIWVESEPDKGSTFYFSLPADLK